MIGLVDLWWLVPLGIFGLGAVVVDAVRRPRTNRPRTLYIVIYGLLWAAAIIPCLLFK